MPPSTSASEAIGPLPFGLIYDLLGSYTAAITGVIVLPVAATAAVLLAFPPGSSDHASGAIRPDLARADPA